MSEGATKSRAAREVRVSMTYRQFQLPPIGDGLLIGRRASVGPTALYEAVEHMLPGMYELIRIGEHDVVEAALVLRSHFQMLGKDRLLAAMLEHGSSLMDAAGCLQVSIRGEVSVETKVEG